MKKGTLEELLPQEVFEHLLISSVRVGEVYRMHFSYEDVSPKLLKRFGLIKKEQ